MDSINELATQERIRQRSLPLLRKNYLLNNLVFILKCHASISLNESRKDAFGRIKSFAQLREKYLQDERLRLDKVKIGAFYLEKKLEIFSLKLHFEGLKKIAKSRNLAFKGAQLLARILQSIIKDNRQKYS
jgi:hypothetical protein